MQDHIDIVPGDLIELRTYDGQLVSGEHQIRSQYESRWCEIGSKYVHLCIAVSADYFIWFNEKGLFKAMFIHTFSDVVKKIT